jgi:hypothetical protein
MFSSKQLRGLLPIAGLACGALICSSAIAGQPELEVVVYSGLDNSPPNFPGLYWNLASGFSNPVIDDSGNIAFVGTIFGKGIIPANNRVIYYGDGKTWTNVARNGDPAPGLPGINFLNIANIFPSLVPNGKLTVSSSLVGPGITAPNDTAFWYGSIGALDLMAQENTTIAPNSGGAVLSSAFGALGVANNIRSNNAGQVLFNSNLAGGSPAVTAANNFGVYIGSSSGITEVARKGNPIPGAPALPDTSGPFMTPDSFGMFMNGAGEVFSTGTLVAGTAGGVTTSDDKVLYTTVGGSLRIVARENSPVPGMDLVKYKATGFFNLPTMAITNSGQVLFNATLDNISPGTSVTTANDTIWLVDDHTAVSTAVREGDAIDGETFNFAQIMMLNNNNRIAMAGGSTAPTTSGRLWTGPLGGPYDKIVQQGVTTVPGDPTVILDFSASSANMAFNSAGQIVFNSNLIGPGVTPGINDRGIFGWAPDTGLVLIARNGPNVIAELLEVAQLVLIGGTGITGENGSHILTDNGWLTFRMQDVKGFQAIIRTRPFDLCPADITGNEIIDVDDLLAIINAWGACIDPENCPADLTGNDIVDVDDLLLVINGWGACP